MAKTKVFGIGLNKTGTSTLGECMTALGYRHMSCRRDLLILLRQGRLDEIFSEIDKHDSFEDWPYPLMYRELFQRYPDARFILTTRRTPQAWLNSLKTHSLYTKPSEQCRSLAYGHAYPHGFEKQHLAIYDRHNSKVEQFFKDVGASDRLLKICWERGDGWRELCAFIDAPQPPIPLPHANKARTGITAQYLQNLAYSFALRSRRLWLSPQSNAQRGG